MYKFWRSLHNWLGLMLVAQITLWLLSGLVITWLPIDEVRGAHLRQTVEADWQLATQSPASVLSHHGTNAHLSLTQRLTFVEQSMQVVPVYSVEDSAKITRYNAQNGDVFRPLNESDVRLAATTQYTGPGEIDNAALLSQLPQEVQQLPAPIWQVQYNDDEHTRLYIDPNTGSVLRVRTDTWRLFDFMWMLHIMDYKNRSDFNNPLVIGFSAAALLFTFTGIILLWQRFRPKKRRLFS